MMPFNLIVAVDARFGIGKNGILPWKSPVDLIHFKEITTRGEKENIVIMGRKTWDSLPKAFRPLPRRKNIVMTRQDECVLPEGVGQSSSLEKALQMCLDMAETSRGEIFVIGGGQIFQQAISLSACQRIYLTRIEKDFFCDVFFPEIPEQFVQVSRQGPIIDRDLTISFVEYQRQ